MDFLLPEGPKRRQFMAVKKADAKRRLARFTLVMTCAVLLLAVAGVDAACAADYRVRRKTAEFTVDAVINRNPPVLGHNTLRIEITDRQGAFVTDAAVTVNYYMPPMPGMAPMNYTIRAARSGRGYETVMDLIMTGPWIIVIKADTKGKVWRASFPIDVR
jgi:hypothetical protein